MNGLKDEADECVAGDVQSRFRNPSPCVPKTTQPLLPAPPVPPNNKTCLIQTHDAVVSVGVEHLGVAAAHGAAPAADARAQRLGLRKGEGHLRPEAQRVAWETIGAVSDYWVAANVELVGRSFWGSRGELHDHCESCMITW